MSDTIQRKFIVLPGGGGVTDVTATAPLLSSGAPVPDISITPGTNIGDTLVWNGLAWGVSTPFPVAPQFEWNLDGILTGAPTQPGSFDGMPAANAALVGPGPFDGGRLVSRPGTIVVLGFILRASAAPVTSVELYRMRAGLVASLGTLGLGATGNAFSGTFTAPAPLVAAVLPGDVLFVALAAAGIGAEDLSVYIQVT